jgi:hypothetical protein
MDRSNHYEAAFEAYLQSHRWCYIAVDETRRAVLGQTSIKSLDFLVYGDGNARLLIDVKGRCYPGQARGKDRFVWECWSVLEDIDGLERWRSLLGADYRGLFVFSYLLQPRVEVPEETEDLWHWRGRRYLFRAIPVEQYRRHMRLRSPKWGTVDLPRRAFRQLVRPLGAFLHGDAPATQEVLS